MAVIGGVVIVFYGIALQLYVAYLLSRPRTVSNPTQIEPGDVVSVELTAVASFQKGDEVRWAKFDDDIRSGAIGVITALDDDEGRLTVRYGRKKVFKLKSTELTKVEYEPNMCERLWRRFICCCLPGPGAGAYEALVAFRKVCVHPPRVVPTSHSTHPGAHWRCSKQNRPFCVQRATFHSAR